MGDLNSTLVGAFTERYTTLACKVRELAEPLSEQDFWRKPFGFGNSFGHLVLHLTGNLNYYIGAEVGDTGYVRDREREFTETNHSTKDATLKNFDEAVDTVLRTLLVQASEDWSKEYKAVREEDANDRMAIFLRCVTHMDHHVGQMMYLCYALKEESEKPIPQAQSAG
ncbi:MAG: DinB family protein [Terriglobales bacterium]